MITQFFIDAYSTGAVTWMIALSPVVLFLAGYLLTKAGLISHFKNYGK